MSYQVTARKWRPQSFDEVVYQDHVSKTLKNSIEKKRVSHAYLFSGPRGVGKTTMARILAKALNCETGPTPVPCGSCDNCREIKNSTSFDVIEIDGASNRGIDDIRELRENVNFAPVKSKYKIYIIDEVHMLTKEAFNALLKTLEEPPPHAVFIFATTEIHQIPDTILSRCQKYFFKKIPVDAIVEHLRHIVSQEQYRISDRALYPIARAADGSMRDAQSLLDQVISFSDQRRGGDEEIGESDALSILGIVPLESYAALLGSIAAADAAATMAEVNRVAMLGVDIPRYVNGFTDILRTIRLMRNGISVHELLGLSAEETEMVRGVSSAFFDEELSLMFRIAGELQAELRFSNNERINLEMALLDMIAVKKAPSISSIIGRLEGGASPEKKGTARAAGRNGTRPAAEKREPEKTIDAAPAPGAQPANRISRHWDDFLNSIKDSKQYLHCILKPSSVRLNDNTLFISYPGGADHSYYSRILEKQNLEFIKKEMSDLYGSALRVVVGTDAEGAAPASEARPKQKDAASPAAGGNVPEDAEPIPMPEAEMLKNPGAEEFKPVNTTVEKIKSAFHGEIIDKGDK
ncbi:MAG: DNA polymerase III subunit gamma/tau [Spirochaetes bacterium]|nr:DNA polymerase III subunit gamma/tau [Spirochaetota bacterium]